MRPIDKARKLRRAAHISARAALFLLALAGIALNPSARAQERNAELGWHEIKWPLAFDPWPAGRAFRCDKHICEASVELYVRPKLGFCNCTVGITEDSEIDLVGDLAAISPDFAPLSAGRPVTLGDMKGLARHYRINTSGKTVHALAIVTSKKCDVVVVTIASTAPLPADTEHIALALLNSAHVLPWIAASVGTPP